jgi:DNA-binding beta-propeller fold protein YncE
VLPQVETEFMRSNTRIHFSFLLFLVLGITGFVALPVCANETGTDASIETFPVGPQPWGLTTDGDNIWVTSTGSDNVTKLRASDGTILGTFPAGGPSLYATFDGANIWVSHFLDSTVTKLRASDGALLGTFPVGTSPFGILFDGANIWVTNYYDDTVSKLDPTDGTILGTFGTGFNPYGSPSTGRISG